VKAFDDYLYLSGIQQGRCYETAVNTWRQRRNSENNSIHESKSKSSDDHKTISSSQFSHTMGILYWQLNDVWPGPSWSSLEYGGKWKPLQYVIKRIFDSVVLSISTSCDSVDIYVTNDGLGAVRVHGIRLCLFHWVRVKGGEEEEGGDIQREKETGFVLFELDSMTVLSGDSILLKSLLIKDQQLALADCRSISCYLKLQASGYNDGMDDHERDDYLRIQRKIEKRRWMKESEIMRQITDEKTSHQTLPVDEMALHMMFPVYHFLTSIKLARLAIYPLVVLDGFKFLSDRIIEFRVSVNVTSPFLWMEYDPSQIHGASSQDPSPYADIYNINAGWFSDNNFLAEDQTYYTITYASYSQKLPSIDAFKKALNVRVLQQVNI